MGRLFKKAMQEMQQGIMHMCYVQPPMGTPFPHTSGTSGMSTDQPVQRAGNWSKRWTLPGTRGDNGEWYENRWLCLFNPKGPARRILELGAGGHGPDSWWLTRAPYCIRPDDMSVHPDMITNYRAYAQDCRGAGVWAGPGGSWHPCAGAPSRGGSVAL